MKPLLREPLRNTEIRIEVSDESMVVLRILADDQDTECGFEPDEAQRLAKALGEAACDALAMRTKVLA